MIKINSSSIPYIGLVLLLSFGLFGSKVNGNTRTTIRVEAKPEAKPENQPEVNLESQTTILQDTALVVVQDSTSQSELKVSIFNYLAQPTKQNPNVVMVYQNKAIKALIEKPLTTSGRGYRIQIYSSNNGDHARWEALKIEKELKETLPNMAIYTTYTAPFWKVRIGNCNTRDEAQLLRTFIMEKFPDYRTQTYIVPSPIEQ